MSAIRKIVPVEASEQAEKKGKRVWRQPAVVPRLLELESAAAYLGLSPWTVRDLIENGTLRRVMIQLPAEPAKKNGAKARGPRDMRKVLLDREDLDALVASWKVR